MMKRNNDIRAAAKENRVYLYEIAEKIGISEPTFIRRMRKELSDAIRAKVFAAIEEIKREHENEPSAEN